METVLKYGSGASVTLELPGDVLLANCGEPHIQPLDDPAAAVAAALAEPLGLPSLDQCLVPGDTVALVLEENLPQTPLLVAGVVQSLREAGVTPHSITVVEGPLEDRPEGPDPRSAIPTEVAKEIQHIRHDPDDREQLWYLAASHEGKPVYLNQTLCDADLVLTLGCLRPEGSLGYHGIHSGLYPAFSNTETRNRFRAPSGEDSPVSRRRRCEEANEAAWLLGVTMTIQVVPGSGDSLLQVLAGEVVEVSERGRELCESVWSVSIPSRASLVVAAVEGDAAQQTWDNVARALAAARGAVADGGAIALCTQLETPPGPALQRLVNLDSYDAALLDIRRERSADALPASQLLQALESVRIYLVSELDEELVEDLGIAPVTEVADLGRLASRHESCIVLSSAQYAVPRAQDEAVDSVVADT